MAARSSSPALHAARTILKDYQLTKKTREEIDWNVSFVPAMQANEAHLSVLIDAVTGCRDVVNLRPEWQHWVGVLHTGKPDAHMASQVYLFAKKIVAEFSKVPQKRFVEEIKRVSTTAITLDSSTRGAVRLPSVDLAISAYAELAVVHIRAFFHVRPYKKVFVSDAALSLDLCQIVELSLGMRKAMPCLELAKKFIVQFDKNQLRFADVKQYFRQFGVLLEYLPNYDRHEEETKLLV